MGGRRFSEPLAETAAQVDDRHHHAAKVEHAVYIVRLFRQVSDVDHSLISRIDDVDAILVVVDGETDVLRQTCRPSGVTAGGRTA